MNIRHVLIALTMGATFALVIGIETISGISARGRVTTKRTVSSSKFAGASKSLRYL